MAGKDMCVEATEIVSSQTLIDVDASSMPLPPLVDSGKKKKPSRKMSTVWDHFTKVDGGESFDPNDLRATCNYYKKSYACDTKKYGTSSLWNHLSNQCKRYPHRVEDKIKKILSFREKVGSLMAVGFSKEACRVGLNKMVVFNDLPFSFVKNEGFKLLCGISSPKFTPLSRKTIARDVFQFFVYGADEVTTLTNCIKDVLVQLYDFYLNSNEQAPQAPNVGSSSNSVPMEVADGSSIKDARLSQFLKIRKQRNRGVKK
ncbi:hypothetical protein ACFX13_032915 [Malus domestica]